MRIRTSILMTAALALATAAASAAPTYTFVRQIEYLPHPIVGNIRCGIADASGGVYIGDSGTDDELLYVADPLTSDGTNDNFANTITIAGSNPDGDFGSSLSWTSITYDGTNYYASGYNSTETNLARISGFNPWTYTPITITGAYGGGTAVGANKLVFPDFATGALQFFDIAGNAATADGSAIANPSATGFNTNSAVYYDAPSGSDYIFVSMWQNLNVRRVDYFTTNGTAAGTTYGGTLAAAVTSTVTGAGLNLRGQLTVDTVNQLLVVPNNNGTDNGWDIFDIATVSAGETPVATIRGPQVGLSGAQTFNASGSAIFVKGATRHLALLSNNDMYVLAESTAVSDWSMY